MNALPWVAFILALAATVSAAYDLRRPTPWTKRLAWAAAGAAVATFLALLWQFIEADVRYAYVFLYTHADLPLRYRIAGTWAGREGSLTLWAMLTILIAAWMTRRWHDGAARWSLVPLMGLATAFLGAVAMSDLFAPTSSFFLQQRPLGNGLNPTLRSDFFLIHPPMMFVAYALTNVPAASAIGHLLSGHGRWSRQAEAPARLNWMLYTIAMGLGGVWAYYTLGFGGFWAWDPVEVANLLPWLGLTLYLHAQRHHVLHGRYASIGPFLALLPFLLTVFSTISTRSGLWVSVHAFTDPTQTFNPDAVGRFLDILGVETTLAFPVGLFLAVAFAGLALWARRLAIEHNRFHRGGRITAGALGALAVYSALDPVSAYTFLADLGRALAFGRTGMGLLIVSLLAVLLPAVPVFGAESESPGRWDVKRLNYAAILILGAGLLVLWLWHMAAANGWNTSFYEKRLPYLAAPAMLAMTVFMGLPWGVRNAMRVAAGGLVAAVLVGLASDASMGFMVLAGVLFVAAMDRTRRAIIMAKKPGHQLGHGLLLVAALLNVTFWLNPPALLGGFDARWPIQLMAAPALWGLHRAVRGTPDGRTALLIGVLGGYYMAPVLALAGWWLLRGSPRPLAKPARMHQAGLYIIHLAVALALLGYGGATYFDAHERGTIEGTATLAGINMTHISTSNSDLETFYLNLDTADGVLQVPLRWEPTVGAYYPLPATLRTWDRDVYVSIDQVCLDPCEGPEDQIVAFQPTYQRASFQVVEADLNVHVLPAISLVWAALALFGYGMLLLMRPAQSGIDLSSPSST
ncbi:MAG: cytochrome c biogenesis protein CcsA [Thermoplasmatota archaeon]